MALSTLEASTLQSWKICAPPPPNAFLGIKFKGAGEGDAAELWRHADSIPHVCENGSAPRRAAGKPATWNPHHFPDFPYRRMLPTRSPPTAIRKDHVRLPVTHNTVKSCHRNHHGAEGVWLYYAQGCSDLYYNVGRTLRARNKVEAALLIAQRAGRPDPAAHVALWLKESPMRRALDRPRYQAALSTFSLTTVLRTQQLGPFTAASMASCRRQEGPFATMGLCGWRGTPRSASARTALACARCSKLPPVCGSLNFSTSI